MDRRRFIRNNTLALSASLIHLRWNEEGFFSFKTTNDLVLADFAKGANSTPYILWQWINGCVTKEGITYDLEAFKKAGIKDVQQFLIGNTEADVTDPEITVLSNKWFELMHFALDECKRLGMTFGTHICPGWSASGAPGLLPEDSMQKIVWTKTTLQSDESITITIPKFEADTRWDFYKDICVVAIPTGNEIISKETVLVFTDALTPENKLKQQLPKGEWSILRFGHTVTGQMNNTAPLSGRGLEVDKMSKEALEKFWDLYPAKLIKMAGNHVGTTFKRFELDSYEAGEQTWTKKMPEEFKQRCGYDVLPWLPVLAEFIIDNADNTALFKKDWQQTITALFAENYYQHLAKLINNHGMQFLAEPYGTGHVNFDINAIRGIGDMVMCEFWWGPTTWGWDSILPVASNAHVNGKGIVAAEAFTGQPQFAWKVDLFDLKQAGDRAFCKGVNLFVLHASAHQPWPHAQPGMTMGWWGTQFGPAQTWWKHGAPEWIQYVNRCQMLLQKGLFVADICFLHLTKQKDPAGIAGYKADTCNVKEFIQRFDVRENKLVLPDGMQYSVVIIPANCSINIELAHKIELLVNKGAALLGNGFKGGVGIKGQSQNEEVKKISELLFGLSSSVGIFEKKIRKIGKGKVYTGYEVNEVLQLENISKDVTFPAGEQDILWIHRNDKQKHFYFISNQSNKAKEILLGFRVIGMLPELWNPETGIMLEAPVWEAVNTGTNVLLSLEAYGSIFVVFRKSGFKKNGFTGLQLNGKSVNPFEYLAIKNNKPIIHLKEKGDYTILSGSNNSQNKIQTEEPVIKLLNNDWDISFQQKRGAPPTAHFNQLISFSEHSEKGIKYFSGKANYRKSFMLAANELSKGNAIFLDLGTVKNVATIIVNGKKVNTFWKPPFITEISACCKTGENHLEIEVTNLWPNRMIGDEHEPDDCNWGPERYFGNVTPNKKIGRNLQVVPDWVKEKKERPGSNRITFITMDFFDKDDALLPSGLLGPVKVSVENIWKIKESQ